MLKVIDLFSGIGGFALGLESTGYFKTIQFVENEKWCQKILKKNFPEVPLHDDVKTFKGYSADVVVGGFPCQPFSVAGKGKATQDDRHLWPDMFRVIKETKPTWVIGENVRNIVSISDGMVLEQVYLDLESEGYEVQSFIIPASAVNAPHQRYRTWIVAYTKSNISDGREHREYQETRDRQRETRGKSGTTDVEDTRRALRSRAKFRKKNENEVGKGYANQSERSSKTPESDVADTDNSRWQEQWWQSSTQQKHQTFKCSGQWEFEPNVGRVANGIPNRVDRLKGLGNAIVPQIAYQIGMAIKEAHESS